MYAALVLTVSAGSLFTSHHLRADCRYSRISSRPNAQ